MGRKCAKPNHLESRGNRFVILPMDQCPLPFSNASNPPTLNPSDARTWPNQRGLVNR